jgi:hypothetical protein
MSACNKQPPAGHPFHNTGVACHMTAGHDGPCTWANEPSLARQGIDRLLGVFRNREIASIDAMPERPVMAAEIGARGPHDREIEVTRVPAGPWVVVRFVGGDEYAIWKEADAVYRVGPDGAVEDDPIL